VLGDVASFRPDVICLSNGGSYDLVWDDALFADMRQFLSGSGCPLVLVCQHNTDWDTLDESHRERARWLYERAARICFVAEGNRRAAERHLALDLSRASIVRNPIGVPGEPLPWPGGDVARIACVARLHAKFKGQDLLIDVLSSEKWRDRPWRLELWGAGPDDRYLRQLVHATRLENRVALCGHGADVAAVWRENQLLVLPSRSEGTPLALVEAMACGRPAIATDVGGVGELLSTGGGILVPGWSRALLADALEHAWGRRQEWEDWGREAATVAHAFIDADPGGRLLQIVLDAGR
jgi:glycosyltransferase involved in cell wall biosynthesis